MKNLCLITFIFIFTLLNEIIAQDFSGKYLMQTGNGELVLLLEHKGGGNYGGSISGNGNTFLLQGSIQNRVLQGTTGDDLNPVMFIAELNGGVLTLVMAETDAANQPVLSTAQTLVFHYQSAVEDADSQHGISRNEVIINGMVLSEEQVKELARIYGGRPQPGNYWYDSKSGLYGVVGYSAYGFMFPGHNLGAIRRDVSNGNTNVVVNGRELHQSEWAVWSYILGYWIQPGNYWLDDKGNAGYEGNPMPVANLYSAARQNAYQGQGGDGDNFWSSRFSASNYNPGNQQGYVSVPGHGPVGYGF
jgi:hypothetical protein